MDLGVEGTAVASAATTTLAGFGAIIALGIGVALAIRAAKKFIPR